MVVILLCIKVFADDGLNLNIAFYWTEALTVEVISGSSRVAKKKPRKALTVRVRVRVRVIEMKASK